VSAAPREPAIGITAPGRWPVVVTAIAVLGAAIWYVLGLRLTLPTIFADELIYLNGARTIATHGSLSGYGYGVLTPAVDSIAYVVMPNDLSAYHAVRVIHALMMASAAFPAYLLARKALPHTWAIAVAALTLCVPWMVYSRFVMTEAAFYPLFLLFVLACARALERPTTGRQLAALGAVALAFAARPQGVVLVGAIVGVILAQAALTHRWGETLRTFAPTWIAFGVVGICAAAATAVTSWSPLGSYDVLLSGWWHPHGLLLWAAANVTALSLGIGLLTAAAAPLGVAAMLRQGSPAERALALAAAFSSLALLVTVVVLSESAYGQGQVHERALFYITPLALICALAWVKHGLPRPRATVAAVLVVFVGLAILTPAGVFEARSVDALSFKLWTKLGSHPSSVHLLVIAATLVAAIALVLARGPALLVATFILAALGVALVSDYHSDVSRAATSRYRWVDETLPAGGRAAIVWFGCQERRCSPATATRDLGRMAVYSELFNARVDTIAHVGAENPIRGVESTPGRLRADGTIVGPDGPLHARYVVADSDVNLLGRRVATLRGSEVSAGGEALTLWRTDGQIRVLAPPR
jgi:hypothetical protein